MKLFQREGENFIGFQCETKDEMDRCNEFLRRTGCRNILVSVNGCSPEPGGNPYSAAISFTAASSKAPEIIESYRWIDVFYGGMIGFGIGILLSMLVVFIK